MNLSHGPVMGSDAQSCSILSDRTDPHLLSLPVLILHHLSPNLHCVHLPIPQYPFVTTYVLEGS